MNNTTTLWYEQPAKNFNEALPLGNGRIGAMFYGGVEQEKISLNEDTLWTGWPRESDIRCADIYQRIRELVLEDKKAEAEALFENHFGDFLVQQYLPLGDLELTFFHEGEITNYRRSLSLDRGLGQVSYTADGCQFWREYVISRERQVLAVQLRSSQKGKLNFCLSLKGKLQSTLSFKGNILYLDGNCPIALAEYGDCYTDTDHHHYGDSESKRGVGYRAGVLVQTDTGTVTAKGDTFIVKNAGKVTVYFAIRTSFNGPHKHPAITGKAYTYTCTQDLHRACKAGFSEIREAAVSQHGKLFSRTEFALYGDETCDLPTDRRLQQHQKGSEDLSLYVLLFNYGKYLTIAASQKGTRPMNLQGIWNEKVLPPWSCNYTLNINAEMNYWPTLGLGLFECYEPLVELVRGLHKNGQKTAKAFYGKNGFVTHHATDIWCLTHPSTSQLPDSTKWGFWNMSSGWLTKMLYDYYDYTLDQQYLQSIWPILSDSVTFYKEMLVQVDGELILCPSTSPENTYLEKGKKIAVDKTTAMTMQIVRDVFECYVKAGNILGCDTQAVAELLPKLKQDFLNSDGSLNEWYAPREEWESDHRHLSHLYGLFPGNLFTKEEKEAAIRVLDQRGDNGTGWSLAWKINLWARLGNGERAKKLLDRQLRPVSSEVDDPSLAGGSYPNLLCAHPPFQIDGNFGACSGIIQMLLQTDEKGNPVFLPALPKNWHSGKVENLRIPGNRSVSFHWNGGKLENFEIKDNG